MAGDILGIIRNFLPMIIIAIIYFAHKLVKKTHIVKLKDIQLDPPSKS